jgi:hypothetical protein
MHIPFPPPPFVNLQVGSCLGSFLKSFGDAALPYVETLMPSIAPLLDKARPDEERRIAMCIIDDMLEHSAQGRAKYLSQVRLTPAGVGVAGSGWDWCHACRQRSNADDAPMFVDNVKYRALGRQGRVSCCLVLIPDGSAC